MKSAELQGITIPKYFTNRLQHFRGNIDSIKQRFNERGTLPPMVLTADNVLFDGYPAYMAALESGRKKAPVMYDIPRIYTVWLPRLGYVLHYRAFSRDASRLEVGSIVEIWHSKGIERGEVEEITPADDIDQYLLLPLMKGVAKTY